MLSHVGHLNTKIYTCMINGVKERKTGPSRLVVCTLYKYYMHIHGCHSRPCLVHLQLCYSAMAVTADQSIEQS